MTQPRKRSIVNLPSGVNGFGHVDPRVQRLVAARTRLIEAALVWSSEPPTTTGDEALREAASEYERSEAHYLESFEERRPNALPRSKARGRP